MPTAYQNSRFVLAEISTELDIPMENLLTPDFLRRVAWTPPVPATAQTIGDALTVLGARPWQLDATAQAIADAFVEPIQSPETPSEPDSSE